MVVYTVESGEYSDYTMHAVFSTREKAQKFVDSCRYLDRDNIVERPVDPHMDKVNEGYRVYYVSMEKSGDLARASQHDYIEDVGKWHLYSDLFSITVLAKDEKHAIKIANEKRIQLITAYGNS